MSTNRACYVTEIDLGAPFTGGGMVNDLKTVQCLRKLVNVDVIYLQKLRYVPILLALIVFIFHLMRSFSRRYKVYFSRSLLASTILIMLKPVFKTKVVHQALSVPFPSNEVRYIPRDLRAKAGLNRFELWVRYFLIRFMEIQVLPNTDVVTVAAPEYAEQLAGFGVPKERIKVIPFYVENEFYKQPIKRNKNSVFTFYYVGAFHVYHELSSLIEAFESSSKSNDEIEMLLVGDGPKRSQIENEVARRNLGKKIKFPGSIPHSLMPSFLSKADAFILLTRAPGLPIALLEAAAAGKAIIAVDKRVGDTLTRYFRDKKEAYMIKSFSSEEVSKAMELLYRNEFLRNSLAVNAREAARRHFTEDTTLKSLRDLLSKF